MYTHAYMCIYIYIHTCCNTVMLVRLLIILIMTIAAPRKWTCSAPRSDAWRPPTIVIRYDVVVNHIYYIISYYVLYYVVLHYCIVL